MPIVIDRRLKTRLVEALTVELNKAMVYYEALIFPASMVGLSKIKSLPQQGALAEQLRHYIGDSPFEAFVWGEIKTAFVGPGFNEHAEKKPLTSFPGYEDVTPMASSLVERFSTLPWEYQVCARLPDGFVGLLQGHVGGYQLSDRHRILMGSELKGANLLGRSANALSSIDIMAGVTPRDGWDHHAAYLQVDVHGYYRNVLTEPVMSARDDIFSFFGLGLALDLFHDLPTSVLGAAPLTTQIIVHRLSEIDGGGPSYVSLGEHQQAGIQSLAVASSTADDMAFLTEKLERIGLVFRSDDEGRGLRLSARWLFDSHCGRDELLSFVQAAVAIEILLGDDEPDQALGLTTLMANRCAYLIAKTPAARANILKAFREIYKVRSKIVHRGKSRLNLEEARLFSYLQELIRAVIDKEQRALERARR